MIRRFLDDYWFLSNMYSIDFKVDGVLYKSVEHFYQSHKVVQEDLAAKIRAAKTPSESKKMTRLMPLREDWNEIKLVVMEIGLRSKFNHPYLRDKLLSTGEEYIEEGNTWNDLYWGVDLVTRKGQNHLGKLLMEIRESLKEEYGQEKKNPI